MEALTEKVCIAEYSEVPGLLRTIDRLCGGLGFSSFEIANVKLAASELSTNILKYAREGEVEIYCDAKEQSIEIVFCDLGPGIDFIELALIDGYTTFTSPSLGLGLGAASRSVDDIQISNRQPQGLQVKVKKSAKVKRKSDFENLR